MSAPPPPPPGAPPAANVAAGTTILAASTTATPAATWTPPPPPPPVTTSPAPAAAAAAKPAVATPKAVPATTPTAAAKPATPTAATGAAAVAKPAPVVSGGLAARMAALNANAAPAAAAKPVVDRPPSTTKGVAVSAGLAGKMNALALNPGIMRAGSTKKSMADIMFEKFDADGSGTIDDGEMHLLCNKLGYLITASETKLVVKALDLDGSGKIDKNEFKIWWNKDDRWASIKLDEKDLAVRASASEAFSSFDTEGKGVIGKKDYDPFYASLAEKKLTTKSKEAVFADLDKNNDGSISFAEYCEWLEAIGTVKVKVLTQAMVEGAKNLQLRGATGLHPAILKDGK